MTLSVAMLVRNPPLDRMAALVEYMKELAVEFIIVDTGSTQEELEVMASWNKHPFATPKVKIIQRPWKDDFAWARNEGLPYVTQPWTLHLDPDELPSYQMMNFIKKVITSDINPDALGYLFYTPDFFGGKRDPYYEYQWHVRLFRSGHGKWYRKLDELVILDGQPEYLLRGGNYLPKAPVTATLIHSKSSDATVKSRELYDRMEKDNLA